MPTKADSRSDEALVRVCNEGSARQATRAFDTLYGRHKAYVLRVARRFIDDHDLALDVLQDTFIYLLRKFPPQGAGLELTARLTTLLYPVAKHCALAAREKSRRFVSDQDAPEPVFESDPDPRSDIEGLFSGLTDERREVLLLRFVDDLSLEEIANALEIPLGTVKSRLHTAIQQLKKDPKTKEFFKT